MSNRTVGFRMFPLLSFCFLVGPNIKSMFIVMFPFKYNWCFLGCLGVNGGYDVYLRGSAGCKLYSTRLRLGKRHHICTELRSLFTYTN